jgi:glutaredoxin
MLCPKCGYARKAKETVGSDQCPSCGVYYAKVKQPEPGMAAPRMVIYAEEKSFPWRQVLGWALMIMVGYFAVMPVAYRQGPHDAASPLVAPDGRTLVRDMDLSAVRVEMYSLTTCGYCKQLRRVFQANNIPFREYMIDEDMPRQQELFAKLERAGFQGGGVGTPTLDINGKMMPNNPPLEDIVRQIAAYARKA